MKLTALELDRDGAELLPGLACGILSRLEAALSHFPADAAGIRIVDCPPVAHLLCGPASVGARARELLGPSAAPVRALLFDKSPRVNWALDWHQDRTIAVAERRDAPGFSNWNAKQGITHVEPPFSLLSRMLTARIHLDAVNADNGVLEIVTGSHAIGRIAEDQIGQVAESGVVCSCPAEPGDVWLYRTPIIHRSARSHSSRRRRVLQVDFSADELPSRLAWRGV